MSASERRPAKDGIGVPGTPRRIEVKNTPSDCDSIQGESVKSRAGVDSVGAQGPSPLPTPPWHTKQFAAYTSPPRATRSS
jgi:hypothetical protein